MRNTHKATQQASSPELSRMVISRDNFKINERGKTSQGRFGMLKGQAQVHAAHAWGREEEGTHRSCERGRGRFAATFCFDHCNRRRNATKPTCNSSHAMHATPLASATISHIIMKYSCLFRCYDSFIYLCTKCSWWSGTRSLLRGDDLLSPWRYLRNLKGYGYHTCVLSLHGHASLKAPCSNPIR
jgi:hypothetical protein